MIRHSLLPFHRRRGFYFILLSVVLLLSARKTAIVSAQSSCSTPQSISAPFSFTPSSVELEDNSFAYPTFTICDDARASGSLAFPTGLWFRYIPSKTTMTRVYVEAIEEFLFSVETAVITGSCDSLECEDSSLSAIHDDLVFQAEVGVEYFIYAYSDADVSDPFTLFVEELEPPVNDQMENAVALTQADLPFRGDFTTVGALSDFDQDFCGLFGEYGVWFKYSTTYYQESLALRATTGNTREVLGVQARISDRNVCVKSGSTWGSTMEWTAEAGIEYYILVSEPPTSSGQSFEFTLQSQAIADAPPTPAAIANPISPSTPPVIDGSAPFVSTDSPSGVGSNSSNNNSEPTATLSSGSDPLFNFVARTAHGAGLVIGLMLLEVANVNK